MNRPPLAFAPLARWTALAAAVALTLAGCATPAGAPVANPPAAAPAPAATRPAAGPPAGAASAPTAAVRPDAAAPRPFADVSKSATREDGFVPLWREKEKVWLEIAPERIGKPFLFSVNVAQSVGERGLYGSQMGARWLVEFRRIGNQMQMVARQVGFRSPGDAAANRAVGEGFSESLIASAPVASAEHPERKAVLVDASFLLGDVLGYSTRLEQAFRLPFAADRTNSFFEATRAEAGLSTLSTKVHFAVARIPAPPLLPPGAPAPQTPPPPATTPDARSFFIGFVYNLRELPEQPMAVRAADPRVGYFTDSYTDLSNDLRANPRVHNLKRWRLEKKDPQAALSEPVKPITYWMDRNIPQRYRASVQSGILEWNKAFERIGFKDAIVARQQPDDATFDNMDASHASIRWFVGADVGFAIGPSHSDPRTGEILDADIGMSDVFGRGSRRQARDDIAAAFGHDHGSAEETCTYATDGAQQMSFALDLLEARGELEPDSPETEAFVQAYIKDTITHEVGHTLGLRHNFKASTTVTRAQLRDKAFASTRGISGSVMDYNAFNLALAGEPRGEANMSTLGSYDYWAIEYGYKPLDASGETAALRAIAERSLTDRSLVFADDGDVGGEALDPLVNTFDLGDDPLAYAQRRLALSKELWERVQQRRPQLGDDPERARRSVLAGFRQVNALPAIAAKYVGGMHTERAQPGSGTATFRPVEPARQRQALRFLTDELFSAASFRFRPEFLASLTPDYIEFNRAGPLSVAAAMLALQTQALDRLLDAGTARRLLELPNYLPEGQRKSSISLNEVYATLQSAVWSELKSGKDIDAPRRSLQREHLKRLQGLLTRPSAALPADAISLARMQAVELQGQLRAASVRGGQSVESRAHLQDALALLTEALRATLQRG
ncbi:MAG: zinc-dependent metalloprotease [Burkholderiaceae bacterium]